MPEQAGVPTRRGAAIAVGLVVITAVVAAPQFVLPPALLGSALVGGGVLGVATVMIANRRPPSRTFLILLAPLVFLGVAVLPDATPLTRPAILVGISAFTLAGALTAHRLESS